MVVRWLALSLLLLVKCGAPLYAQTPTFPPKLLAYGDSLTAGFWAGGHHFHPYSTKLSELLGGCTVDHIGLSGWTAGQMRSSLTDGSEASSDLTGRTWRTLRQALEEGGYSHVLFLAGTNDLPRLGRPAEGGGRTAEEVLADLRVLHQAARDAGAVTVAATVPATTHEADVRRYPLMASGRAAINEGVARLARESGGSTVLADVALLLPHEVEGVRRQRWEPDGVHLTPAGYEELSRALFEALRGAGVEGCGGSGAAGLALLAPSSRLKRMLVGLWAKSSSERGDIVFW